MNHVECLRAVLSFERVARLLRWQWARGGESFACWHGEELPKPLAFSQVFDIAQHLGLDPYQQLWFVVGFSHSAGKIERLRKLLQVEVVIVCQGTK